MLFSTIVFFVMALLNIKASHFNLNNWDKSLISVINEQERNLRAKHFTFSMHNVVHTVLVLSTMICPHRKLQIVLLKESLCLITYN